MDKEGLRGFRAGERVIVRERSWGRACRRGTVFGVDPTGALLVRVEHAPTPAPVASSALFHDTPAFYAWLDAELPPGGGPPAPPSFGRRRYTLEALRADNPHLDA